MRTSLLFLTLTFCLASISSLAQEADAPVVTKFTNRSISIGLLVNPEGADEATEIKLVQFKDPLNQKADGPIQGSNGVRYMTLFVDDVMAVVERLKAEGIALEGECPLKLGNGADFVVVKDPDGVFVELIGPGN